MLSLFYGPLALDLTSDEAEWHVLSDNTAFGAAWAGGADLTRDGLDDLIVGASQADPDGAVWILPGSGE